MCAVILEPGVQAAAGMLTLPAGFSVARRRGVPRARRAADSRRGRHRLRPHGHDVRVPARRRDAGSAVRRERADGRLSPCRGDAGHRSHLRRVSRALRRVPPFFSRPHLHGQRARAVPRRSRRSGCCRTARSSARSSRRRACCAMRLRRLPRIAHVGDIRQAGLMCGIELVADRADEGVVSRRAIATAITSVSSLRDRGIFLRPLGDVIVLMPPLVVDRRRAAASRRIGPRRDRGATRCVICS